MFFVVFILFFLVFILFFLCKDCLKRLLEEQTVGGLFEENNSPTERLLEILLAPAPASKTKHGTCADETRRKKFGAIKIGKQEQTVLSHQCDNDNNNNKKKKKKN